MTLGERMKIARKEMRLTQKELGKKAGLEQPTIQRLESGKMQGSSKIVEVAYALGVNPVWLVTGNGSMKNESKVAVPTVQKNDIQISNLVLERTSNLEQLIDNQEQKLREMRLELYKLVATIQSNLT